MGEDFEIRIDDLLLLDDPKAFKKYLYSLHQEIDITDVNGLLNFFGYKGWNEHIKVCTEFEDIFDL